MMNIIFFTLIGLFVCALLVLLIIKYDCMRDDDYDENLMDKKTESNEHKRNKKTDKQPIVEKNKQSGSTR